MTTPDRLKDDMLVRKYQSTLRECWKRSGGKAWEPKGGTKLKFFDWAVAEGYLRIVDGRCMFEIIPDCMVEWTDAGRKAMAQ